MLASQRELLWGDPPWEIPFRPPVRSVPAKADFVIVGAGFTGLAAAAWLRLLAPEKSVIVLEAGLIGSGASGRTGGLTLAETAAGDLPGLGDVLEGFSTILERLSAAGQPSLIESSELCLDGVWEVSRLEALPNSDIEWNDSGTLRVSREVPGGSVDPGKLVSGLAQAAHRLGAILLENQAVESIEWGSVPEMRLASGKLRAKKILLATNALSLNLAGLSRGMHPRITLAAATAPLRSDQLNSTGWRRRKPFYTADLPYLWARIRHDNSIVWGAGLLEPAAENGGRDLVSANIHGAEAARVFAALEDRVRGLHPALRNVNFTHRWGGPILFRDSWTPIFDWHPESEGNSRTGVVLGAYAGHGVALSSYLGAWAAEALLGRRELPEWGKIR